ncbi:SusC/RagA family TonB-linked outer membrane protein [Chryseotalea sanaruensis]|uniref:SusC/RagA family TonB-linked outer membrane protein n=1 Tax=Chryseotalea sanaruensis TaxID=2482724 RepID=UPI000F8DB513|nr:SusC/RagA family TonB-linked outer membrane protein [Chryseotalea sanaruensis]
MRRFLLVCISTFVLVATAYAQERTVSGKVTSAEDGSALPGVNVVVKGTTNGTVTDAEGNFKLSIPTTGAYLVFSFIGLQTAEVMVGERAVLDVSLALDVTQLSEVVVTAGGLTVQRRELGNQATTVKATDITQGKASNAMAGLSGKVPGLLISAVSSGVNPNYRVVLRGQRSLLGNNQALLVLDNVITPSSVLGNLNPEDIEDIQVLNGAGAAALYGSDASNGALIVTTKRGKAGKTEIKISSTTTFENVSYLPQLQKKFGSGTTPDSPPTYTPYENQQYGPRFDGAIRDIGKPIQDGSIQQVAYSSTDARTDFWETGSQNQTDFSISSGDDKSSIYAAAQYFAQQSTVPWDKYKRYSFRVNTDRKIGEAVRVGISTNYIANDYDISSAAGFAYTNVLMSPAQVDITKYKDWQNNPFANPNGYYNEYYDNPYFTLANNRTATKNSYFQGALELKWNPIEQLTITSRLGLSTRNVFSKTTSGKFTFSDYTKSISGSSKTDIPGSVVDEGYFSNQLVGDLYAEYKAKLSNTFSLTLVSGVQSRENSYKSVYISANGLVISGVYNINNTLTNLGGGSLFNDDNVNLNSSQLGIYGDMRLGYKDFAFLHFTGRNDWRSVLTKENRSFFYPAVDASLILSEALSVLDNSIWVDALKVRGGYSQVGQVNIDAYGLNTIFSQAYGYPYSTGGGFSLGNTLVSPDLQPEITTSIEAGFDLDLSKYSASIGMTVYKSNTVDQTIPVQVPSSTGYSTLRTNIGEVENKGIETYIRATPITTSSGLSVSVQATYTLNRNNVVSLSDQSDLMILPGGNTSAQIVAKVGSPFPLLQVTEYKRTPEGKIIVDPITGYPSNDGTFHDVGITTPPHILGLSAEIKYRGFRLAAVAEYRNGHYIYNAISTAFDFSGAGVRTTWYDRERFVIPNSVYEDSENPGTFINNTNVTTATGGADFWTDGSRNTGVGENYTHSAGFWKIREISLRYDFPVSWLSPTKYIKAVSVSVQGRNLFIWTPKTNLYTDPEFSANGSDSNAVGFTNINLTPPARYIGGTLSLTF